MLLKLGLKRVCSIGYNDINKKRNDMKEQILEISKRLDNGKINTIKAQRELCVLFGVIKRYSLETYVPRYREGCEWYILDGKTDCIIESYTSKEIGLAKTKLLELNAL